MSIKSANDIAGLLQIGRIVGLAIRAMRDALEPGMTTAELDAVGARFLHEHGARSAPQLAYKFPGATCISVNDEVAHGIPGSRVIAAGRHREYRRVGGTGRLLRRLRARPSPCRRSSRRPSACSTARGRRSLAPSTQRRRATASTPSGGRCSAKPNAAATTSSAT